LGKKAILTTSYFNEPTYQKEITLCGATILPKFLAIDLDVMVTDRNRLINSDLAKICLIDDDELVRMSWKLSAEQHKVQLQVFDSLESFQREQLDKTATVFFDNNYNGQELGLKILQCLHEQGYSNLYMVTGDSYKFQACQIPHVKKVLGKEFPDFLIESRITEL
jgi:hypothetical protein